MFHSNCQSGNRVADVFGDVENVFNQLFHQPKTKSGFDFRPVWDIAEHADAFEVCLELPGVKPEEVKVEFEDGVLNVSGEKSIDRSAEEVKFHRSDRPYGSFQRTLEFDTAVAADGIEATFEHGLLVIRVPKAEKAVARKIEVKSVK